LPSWDRLHGKYIIPFVLLEEMRKKKTAKVKARALTPNLESIGLCYLDKHGVEHCEGFSIAGVTARHREEMEMLQKRWIATIKEIKLKKKKKRKRKEVRCRMRVPRAPRLSVHVRDS
jgi:hypothetical protein